MGLCTSKSHGVGTVCCVLGYYAFVSELHTCEREAKNAVGMHVLWQYGNTCLCFILYHWKYTCMTTQHPSIRFAHHMSSHPPRPGSLQYHHTSSLGGCTDGMSGTQTGCQHRLSPEEVQLEGKNTDHMKVHIVEYNSAAQYFSQR